MPIIFTILLFLQVVWTIYLYTLPSHTSSVHYLFNLGYAIPMVASIALLQVQKISQLRYKNIFVIIQFACGFFVLAQLYWTISNLLGYDVPYPSIADLFYIFYYLFVLYAGTALLKRFGSIITPASIIEFIATWIVIFLIVSSFVTANQVQVDLTLLAKILNLLYPILDTLLITLTISAIRSQRGHLEPSLLFFLFAFLSLTLADASFAYQIKQETYWNGNFVDWIFALFSYLFALGCYHLSDIIQAKDNLTLSDS